MFYIDKGSKIISYNDESYSELVNKVISSLGDFLEENLGLPSVYITSITGDAVKAELHRQFWLQYLARIRGNSYICRINAEDNDEQALIALKQRFSAEYMATWYYHQGIYSIVADDLIAKLGSNKVSTNTDISTTSGATSTLTKNNDSPQSGDNADLTGDTYLSSSSRLSTDEVVDGQTGSADTNYVISEDVSALLAENQKARRELEDIYQFINKNIGLVDTEE